MRRFTRWLVRIFSFFIILGFAGAGVLAYGFYHYGQDLPNIEVLRNYEPPIVTRVYASNGQLIGQYAEEQRIFVPVDRIPDQVIHAFVAAEDQRFFEHSGVDYIGLVRAMWTNITNIGTDRRLVGGSTITQQVTKNFLLTNERTYERKIREMILAFRIEEAFTKYQILELYMNEIYLGRRAYGVAAAAQTYFGKALNELTIAEAAFLAGLPQAPSRYDPRRNPEESLARRNYVISRMLEDGYITEEQAREATNTSIEVRDPEPNVSVGAEYFVEEVRRELVRRYGDERTLRGGFAVRSTLDPRLQQIADRALRNGLRVYDRRHGWRGPITNLREDRGDDWADNWRQRLADVELPPGYGTWEPALVLNVSRTEAQIGFADGRRGVIPFEHLQWARRWLPDQRFTNPPQSVEDVLNLGDVVFVSPVQQEAANDNEGEEEQGARTENASATQETQEQSDGNEVGVYELQQIPDVTGAIVAIDPHTGRIRAMTGGYSFWVTQYNAAVQAERQPGSSFKPFVYLTALNAGFTPSTIILDMPIVIDIEGFGRYKPRNYSGRFYGPTTMRRGLELSRNLMTIRIAQRTGLDRIAEMGERFGIAQDMPAELSMALGSVETTPLRLATAYAQLVNGGRRITPTLIDRIQDRYGRTVYRHGNRVCPGCNNVEWNGQDRPLLPDTREQIADPRTIGQIIHMLRGVVQRGTGASVNDLGFPLGGKTGTTNDAIDAWFVGFSADMVVAVWVGFEQPRTLGARETGGRVAAPVFREFMMHAMDGENVPAFRYPGGLVQMRVNLDTGLPAQEGDERVIEEFFRPGNEPNMRGAMGPDGRQNFRSSQNTSLEGTGGQY